jgi:hypothetical protein
MAKQDDGKVAVLLRLPEALHRRLTEAKQESMRSMHNEIVRRVRDSFDREADEVNA